MRLFASFILAGLMLLTDLAGLFPPGGRYPRAAPAQAEERVERAIPGTLAPHGALGRQSRQAMATDAAVPQSASHRSESGLKRAVQPSPWAEPAAAGKKAGDDEDIWRSQDLNMLAIGLGIGDVTGSGREDIVLIDPNTVYLYKVEMGKMELLAQYSQRALEFKSVDVAKIRKQGPARIYVSAQNREAVTSLVVEYRDGKLVPVIQGFPYYLRVIQYPTLGPILLGQAKGLSRIYEGPIHRVEDKGDGLELGPRFGVPLKIPIFGFAIGDLEGKRIPMIAVYDREEHLRVYTPSGKRKFMSREFYGGSDVLLKLVGLEAQRGYNQTSEEMADEPFRPRILAADLDQDGLYEVLAVSHKSLTGRYLGRMKMLSDGQVVALTWNGDALEEKWRTPVVQGIITDFAIGRVSGIPGTRLITVERKRSDWLSFLSSQTQVRAYTIDSLIEKKSRRRGGD